jgi:hypothetical protein
MVTLVYDADQTGSAYINSASASTITGCWKIAEYDSTNTHQLRMYYGYYKPTTNLYRYMLCFQKDSTQVVPVNAVENSTATTKTLTTEAFNPFGFILYYNSTTTINAGSVISAGTLYEQIHLDLRYSFNTAKNLTANKDIYIVTNLQSDGMVKLDSSPITQTLPNSDDGKLYIYLGQALSTYQIEIRPYHPVYWYKDGKVQLYTPMSANALRLTATSKTAWGRTFWTANGVPDSISGDMRSVGSVFLNNVASLRWKKNGASSGTDEDYLPVMVVSTDNNLYLGPFNAGKTCATIIYGKPIRFYTKSSDGNNTGVLAATIDADSNFKTEGSIYLNNNNTSIYFKNSASTGVPLLTFDNSSTSVFKVGDGSYPTKTYGSSIEMYAGTNKVASFKMLDGVRTAEFTSQVIIQNNTSLGFYKSDNATIARVLAVNNNATNAVLMGTFMAATPLPLQVYGSDITFYINNGTSNTEAAKIDANKNFTAQGSVVGMKGVAAYGIADLALITD